MAKLFDDIARHKKLLTDSLNGRSSQLLLNRLLARLDDVAMGRTPLEDTLRGIQIALRLFVGEELAATVNKDLRGLPGQREEDNR